MKVESWTEASASLLNVRSIVVPAAIRPGFNWTECMPMVATRVPLNPRSATIMGISRAMFNGLFHSNSAPRVNLAPETALMTKFFSVGASKAIPGFKIPQRPMTGGDGTALGRDGGIKDVDWRGIAMGANPILVPESVKSEITSTGGGPMGVVLPKR